MRPPSGDQRGSRFTAPLRVSGVTASVVTSSICSSIVSPAQRENTIREPSGDQSGWKSYPGPSVSCTASVSVTACRHNEPCIEYTSSRPSGDQATEEGPLVTCGTYISSQ